MSRLLSLAHLTVLELTPPEVVACAAAAGYRACNLRLSPARPGEAQHPMLGASPMRRETLARLRDSGLVLLDFEVVWLRPETRAADYEPIFAVAAELGARHVLVAGGDADHVRTAGNFAEICALAKRYGLGAALEFIVWTQIRSLAEALAILRASGADNAGVLVDALHAARAGTSLADIAALDPATLPYMQICDGPAVAPPDIVFEARSDRLAPGAGGLRLAELLGVLPADIPVSVETPETGAAGAEPPLQRALRLRQATEAVLAQAHTKIQS